MILHLVHIFGKFKNIFLIWFGCLDAHFWKGRQPSTPELWTVNLAEPWKLRRIKSVVEANRDEILQQIPTSDAESHHMHQVSGKISEMREQLQAIQERCALTESPCCSTSSIQPIWFLISWHVFYHNDHEAVCLSSTRQFHARIQCKMGWRDLGGGWVLFVLSKQLSMLRAQSTLRCTRFSIYLSWRAPLLPCLFVHRALWGDVSSLE